jgi:hypothetical protein
MTTWPLMYKNGKVIFKNGKVHKRKGKRLVYRCQIGFAGFRKKKSDANLVYVNVNVNVNVNLTFRSVRSKQNLTETRAHPPPMQIQCAYI